MSPRVQTPPPPEPPKKKFSMMPEDAIESSGLFGSGPAHVEDAYYGLFDYNGTVKPAVLVLFVKYARGEGRDKEIEQQPYGIGTGWSLNAKTGELVSASGQAAFNRSTNVIAHLMVPLVKALEEAGLPQPAGGFGDPTDLIGMDVVLERVKQRERKGFDSKAVGGRQARPPSEASDPPRDKTILEIHQVLSAPWLAPDGLAVGRGLDGASGGKKAKPSPVAARANAQPVVVEDDDDDEDDTPAPTPAAKAKPNGKAQPAAVSPSTVDVSEEAAEALVALAETGQVAHGDLEARLEVLLKDHPHAPAIIDLAVSKRFLGKELGWSFDGKTLDAPA